MVSTQGPINAASEGALNPVSLPPEPSVSGQDASMLLAGWEQAAHPLRLLRDGASQIPAGVAAALNFVGGGEGLVAILLGAGGLVAVGLSADWIVQRLVHRPEASRLGLLLRSLAASVGFAVSGAVAHWLLPLDGRSRAVALALLLGVAFVRTGTQLAVLAAKVGFGDATAALRWRVAGALSTIAVAYVVLGVMRLAGVPEPVRMTLALGLWVALVAVAAAVLAEAVSLAGTSRAATPGDAALRRREPLSFLLWSRGGWFYGTMVAAIAVTIAVFILRYGPGAISNGSAALLVLGLLPLALAFLPPPPGSTGRSLRTTAVKCTRLAVFVLFWLAQAYTFDISVVGVGSDGVGEKTARILINVAVAAGLGYLAWELALAGLDGLLHAENAHLKNQDTKAARFSRVGTFVPLLRNLIAVFILATSAMIVLSSLGVDIGPLLAGAGIVGIAIGFGSQALVKDVISGLFFLADDAFRLGEYVELSSAKGTVESISIRSIKLRHPRGAVYTVPFGDVGVVNNQSRDYAIVKLEFVVEVDTDLVKAKKVVRQIAADIEAHEEFAAALLEPVKFQGVRRMEPRGLVVGVKFMARPGQQFTLRREVYARVRDAFRDANISFAKAPLAVDGPTPGEEER